MTETEDRFSGTQEKTILVIRIIPSLLSVAGSSIIVWMILRPANGKATPYQRVLLGLSIADILQSLILLLVGFLVPAGLEAHGNDWAFGTEWTCQAIAFLQTAMPSTWYNCGLSLYFLLIIRFRMQERIFARRVEIWIHTISIGFPLFTAILYSSLGLHGPMSVGVYCWVPVPEGDGPDQDATRMILWFFNGMPAFLQMIFIIANYGIIYFYVRNTIARSRAREFRNTLEAEGRPVQGFDSMLLLDDAQSRSSQNVNGRNGQNVRTTVDSQTRRLQAVATQACLYVGSYLVCHSVANLNAILEGYSIGGPVAFPLYFVMNILLPIQGLLNVLIYARPRYLSMRLAHPDESRLASLKRAILESHPGAQAGLTRSMVDFSCLPCLRRQTKQDTANEHNIQEESLSVPS